jgi:circadian clock protein KaiC
MTDQGKPASAATGVSGMDDILRGGFPAGRLVLIEGDPGVGKTTLALQFLLEGARQGERGVYVTLSETREELESVAASHGWSLDSIELFELTPPDALRGDEQNTLFHPSEVELAETTKAVVDLCARVKPTRLVFDYARRRTPAEPRARGGDDGEVGPPVRGATPPLAGV